MATLQLRKVKETKNVATFLGEVLPEDLAAVIKYTAEVIIEEERSRGRNVSFQLVDGRRAPLEQTQFRVQLFYGDQTQLIQALDETWELLVKLTRIKSGRARASYALYKNGTPVGGRDSIAQAVKASKTSDTFSVVGPGVPYGRKLFWRPFGKQRQIKKKQGAYRVSKTEVVKVYGTYTEPMHKAVLRALNRRQRYPALWMTDQWVDLKHGGGPAGQRWPAITIGMKGQGK
jgi:hypothetical protein